MTETRDDLLAIKGLAERVPDEEGALALVAPRAIARLASHARARIEFVSP